MAVKKQNMKEAKELPEVAEVNKELPGVNTLEPDVDYEPKEEKELPEIINAQNTVMIGGIPVELKPTLLRYQRDRTANFYRVLEIYPLIDIVSLDAEAFGDGRTGDQALLEWLIAVFDDSVGTGEAAEKRRNERIEFVKKHYNQMDAETIEKILTIFKRINRITEKEEKLKNAGRGTRKG